MKKFWLILFCSLSIFLISEESSVGLEKIEHILPLQSKKLIDEGKLLHFCYNGKDEGEKIVFNSPLVEKIEKMLEKQNYIFACETLHFVKKTGVNKQKNIEKILCSISSLKGLQYYSPSRKKMRLLYKDSYVVKREERSDGEFVYTKVEDPINKPFNGLKIFVSQEDLTFGKNIYQFQYFKEDYGLALLTSNIEPLYYSIFKAIEKDGVNSYLVAYDLGDYLLVYTAVKANFRRIIGLETKIKNSFMARLDAISSWFIEKYNE